MPDLNVLSENLLKLHKAPFLFTGETKRFVKEFYELNDEIYAELCVVSVSERRDARSEGSSQRLFENG
jgi:hypothetical protein